MGNVYSSTAGSMAYFNINHAVITYEYIVQVTFRITKLSKHWSHTQIRCNLVNYICNYQYQYVSYFKKYLVQSSDQMESPISFAIIH